mmetsp:Transcript_34742/g.78230  ORF Transcript_34742/g.78230 Transcript_34742/m.78230 type:complete len:307 (-) Transcript_34742:43-963(-)
MQKLAQACGVQDVEVMFDNECTKENVKTRIEQMGQRCDDDDFFIFYYSGHGTSMEDLVGDEEDGMDEALCFVGPQGQLGGRYFMRDDEFAEIVTDAIPEETRILILTDCCHSGTIGDLDKDIWEGREVISVTGCADSQTSGDMGKGGIFTHSMLLAIDHLQRSGEEDYSVGLLYNATVFQDDKVFNSAQDITIECPPAFAPHQLAWPLVPLGDYSAPLSQALHTAGMPQGDDDDDEEEEGYGGFNPQVLAQMLASNPALCQQLGISPQMAHNIVGIAGIAAGPGAEFVGAIQGGLFGGRCTQCVLQ